MLAAIKFYNHTFFKAQKIDNIIVDWDLSAEFETVYLF